VFVFYYFGIRAKSCSFPLSSTKPLASTKFSQNPSSPCQLLPKKNHKNVLEILTRHCSLHPLQQHLIHAALPAPQRRQLPFFSTASRRRRLLRRRRSPTHLLHQSLSSWFSLDAHLLGHDGSIESRGDLHSTKSNFPQIRGNDEGI